MRKRSIRRFTLILVGLVSLYTLLGFFVLPLIVHPRIEKIISEYVQGTFSIGQVKFNPFCFSTSLKDIEIENSQKKNLFSVGRVDVDFMPWKIIKGTGRIDTLNLEDVLLVDPSNGTEVIKLPRVSLNGIEYDWSNNELRLRSFTSSRGDTKLAVDQDGVLNITELLNALLKDTKKGSPAPGPDQKSRALALTADSLAFESHTFSFVNALEDEWAFEKVNFQVTGFYLAKDRKSKVQLSFIGKDGGRFDISGDMSLDPRALDLKVLLSNIPIKRGTPFVREAGFELQEGTLSAEMVLQLELIDRLNLGVSGDISLDQPVVLMKGFSEPLFSADQVVLSSAALTASPLKISAEKLLFKKPAVYFQSGSKAENGSIRTVEESPEGDSRSEVSIKWIELQDGSLTFVDLANAPSIRHEFVDWTAEIKEMSLAGSSPVFIKTQGKLYGEGSLEFSGHITPAEFPSGIKAGLNVDHMPLRPFSAYAGKFLGRKISSGKLSANIKAELEGEQVKGQNNFVLHRFELGDSVKSEEAIAVPLDTVIALLREGDGKISIDLPVEGKSTDPSFRYMKLLGRTFRNRLLEVATSPVTLLGSLYHWSGGDLEQIKFNVSSAELAENQMKKLDLIARALLDKPELELEIHGGSSVDEVIEKEQLDKVSALAELRAKTIKDYLAFRQIPTSRLFLAGGKTDQEIEEGRVASELKISVSE
ncbi:DUF748 domain-containing protein [Oligoflexia bacterium]|nr:DUF748 domain-containing protein [Oligoflexia bacterium]